MTYSVALLPGAQNVVLPGGSRTPGSGAYNALVLGDKPVALWADTSGTDATGHGHTMTLHASPATTQLPNGDLAWKFDGATQYCETPDADDLSPVTTGVFTVEAWIRPDVLTFPHEESTGYVHWAGKGTGTQQEFVNRMYGGDNTEYRENRISGYAFNLAGGTGNGAFWETAGGETAGTWLHYVLVINSVNISVTWPSGYVTIYRNAVNTNTQTLAGITLANSTSPLRLGTRDFASFFQGAIGKYAVYNYELTAAQVLAHYRVMAASMALLPDDGYAQLSAGSLSSVVSASSLNGTASYQVTIASGLSNLVLPNGVRYKAGDSATLSDADYSKLSAMARATFFSSTVVAVN